MRLNPSRKIASGIGSPGGREDEAGARCYYEGAAFPNAVMRRPITILRQSMKLKSFAALLNYRYAVIMTATVTINQRGNLTLPAAIRKEMGLSANDQMIAETTDEGILLRPAITMPLEIYTDERIAEFELEEARLAEVLKRKRKI